LEILKVLWRTGPAGLGAVRGALQGSRPVASTTVATMLKLMAEKGLVRREDGPKGYLWSAAVDEGATRSGLLRKLVDLAFEGSARRMIAHLFEAGDLSDQDRAAIRRMLDARRAKRPPKGGERS